MTTYTINGMTITASGPAELVRLMNEGSFSRAPTELEFMVQTAGRIGDQFGKEIRSDTAAHFVADMIDVGIIKEG